MARKTIPFSVDITGNFVYSQQLREARKLFQEGTLSAADLLDIENKEIQRIVDNCKTIGLKCVTDGHYRTNGYIDFFNYLQNASVKEFEVGDSIEEKPVVSGKIYFDNYYMSTTPMTEHFTYLTGIIGGGMYAKALLPSPATLYLELIRPENRSNTGRYYPDKELLMSDLTHAYRQVIAEFYDMGCRFIQFTDYTWNLTGDSDVQKIAEAYGIDLVTLASSMANLMNACIAGKPADLCISLQFDHAWWRAGFKAEMAHILSTTAAEAVALDFGERDNEEIDFSILNYCQGKEVILELVSVTNSNILSSSVIAHHVENAARLIPLESLHLGCRGNFRDLTGNSAITEQEMWNKLTMLKNIANTIWGE